MTPIWYRRFGACWVGLGLAGMMAVAAPAWAADPPDVLAARETYQSVEQLRRNRVLRLSSSAQSDAPTACGCAPYEAETSCTWGKDARGVVRWFEREGGSSDSAITERSYYDAQGQLRFVFVRMGAVNDTVDELRIYFNPQGQRVRATRKRLSGPGYTFPSEWPQQYDVRVPKQPIPAQACPRS